MDGMGDTSGTGDYYFGIITAVDVFALAIMCVFTRHNEVLDARQRRWFLSAFILIMVASVLEVASVAVNGLSPSLRWVNIVVNYLGFGLTPAIPILLSLALEKNRNTTGALVVEAVFLLFMAIAFPFGAVFYVDADNRYARGEFFWVYLAAYVASVVFLLVSTLRVARAYQNRSRNVIYCIVAFLLGCTALQVFFPRLHIVWLCATILSMLYFMYCNSMWRQLDGLTGLLNQNSYLNRTASLAHDATLVVFDIDDFKLVNDTYGHPAGDRCLEEIAACIKKAYAKDGLCYRIGGDEFCALLDPSADIASDTAELFEELDRRRAAWAVLPHLSVGSAPFVAGDDILAVKERADAAMYLAKRANKAQRASNAQSSYDGRCGGEDPGALAAPQR